KRSLCVSGLDGCGKTTQVMLLCNWLKEKSIAFKHIRFQDVAIPQNIIFPKVINYIKNNSDVNPQNDIEAIQLAFS
ncbi:MAG: hypothetical protein LBL93_03895, partial [Ruminococcus sp.]|nr:hypothetical protein [Ruminococcus sp.]